MSHFSNLTMAPDFSVRSGVSCELPAWQTALRDAISRRPLASVSSSPFLRTRICSDISRAAEERPAKSASNPTFDVADWGAGLQAVEKENHGLKGVFPSEEQAHSPAMRPAPTHVSAAAFAED